MRWRNSGFTLIEILVALAILAIAMAALTQASGSNTANASYLRDRALGMWIAENQLVDMQISEEWPRIGSKTGSTEMAGHRWHWKTLVEKVADETTQQYLRAVTIEVRVNETQKTPSATLQGFVSNPQFAGN